MAINIDLSKPLSEEQIEDLRSRLPENLVQHYIDRAKEAAPEKPAAKGKETAKPDILT